MVTVISRYYWNNESVFVKDGLRGFGLRRQKNFWLQRKARVLLNFQQFHSLTRKAYIAKIRLAIVAKMEFIFH